MKKTYYEILEVSPDASQEIINAAHKALARKYHPDKHQNQPLTDLAEEKMKEINEAYSLLSDPDKRKQYDYQFFQQSSEKSEFDPTNFKGKDLKALWKEAEELNLDRLFNAALFTLDYMLDKWPDDASIHHFKMRVLMNIGDLSGAVRAMGNAITRDTDNNEYIDKAIVLATETIKRIPDDPEAFNLLARGLMLKNKYKKAIEVLNEAINLNPHNGKYFYNRALCYTRIDYFSRAIDDYFQAFHLEPEKTKYFDALVNYSIKNSYLENSAEAHKRIFKTISNDPVLLDKYAKLYAQSSHPNSGKIFIHKLREKSPSHPSVVEFDERLAKINKTEDQETIIKWILVIVIISSIAFILLIFSDYSTN